MEEGGREGGREREEREKEGERERDRQRQRVFTLCLLPVGRTSPYISAII